MSQNVISEKPLLGDFSATMPIEVLDMANHPVGDGRRRSEDDCLGMAVFLLSPIDLDRKAQTTLLWAIRWPHDLAYARRLVDGVLAQEEDRRREAERRRRQDEYRREEDDRQRREARNARDRERYRLRTPAQIEADNQRRALKRQRGS